jgi:hypothetical protein
LLALKSLAMVCFVEACPPPLDEQLILLVNLCLKNKQAAHRAMMCVQVNVTVKWGKEKYPLELDTAGGPATFKAQLFALTGDGWSQRS